MWPGHDCPTIEDVAAVASRAAVLRREIADLEQAHSRTLAWIETVRAMVGK